MYVYIYTYRERECLVFPCIQMKESILPLNLDSMQFSITFEALNAVRYLPLLVCPTFSFATLPFRHYFGILKILMSLVHYAPHSFFSLSLDHFLSFFLCLHNFATFLCCAWYVIYYISPIFPHWLPFGFISTFLSIGFVCVSLKMLSEWCDQS